MKPKYYPVLIDPEDRTRVDQYTWTKRHGRFSRNIKWDGNQHTVFLHQFLIGMPLNRKLCTDHINRNPLDNRKKNLRFVTHTGNMQNRKKALGICFHPRLNKWEARGCQDKKIIYLGCFPSRKQALAVYNKWYKEARYVY